MFPMNAKEGDPTCIRSINSILFLAKTECSTQIIHILLASTIIKFRYSPTVQTK